MQMHADSTQLGRRLILLHSTTSTGLLALMCRVTARDEGADPNEATLRNRSGAVNSESSEYYRVITATLRILCSLAQAPAHSLGASLTAIRF
jgi:hypothetical protein